VNLEEAGYRVRVGYDGLEAVALAHEKVPDLILMDLIMPCMDGYEACRRLRRSEETRDVPIVVLTAKDQIMDIVQALDAGADNFITKPYEIPYLLDRVEALLAAGRGPENDRSRAMRAAVEEFTEQIVITRERHQVFRLILETLDRAVECDAVLILNLSPPSPPLLVRVERDGLAEGSAGRFVQAAVAAAQQLLPVRLEPAEFAEEMITLPDRAGARPRDLRSFLHVPILVKGAPVGLMSIAASKPNGYQEDDIRHLYEIGYQASLGLARLRSPVCASGE